MLQTFPNHPNHPNHPNNMEANFLDNYYAAALSFRETFNMNDEQVYYEVAQTICNTLFENADMSFYDPNHPFNRYGAPNTIMPNIDRLAATVRENLHMPQERSALLSFTHPGGMNHDLLLDLMSAYWDYIDYVIENDD